jgi:hypothetical protein
MSTIRVNTLQNTSTTDGGISIDNSGNVTLPANTKVGTQNLPSAGPLSNRNLIINGAMQVAQRGTSVAVSDNSNEGYQSLDRYGFLFGSTHGGACTISQSTTVPANQGFTNSYKVDVTTDSSPTANQSTGIYTKIEAQDVANSGWNFTSTSSFVTLSFWARSTLGGTYCVTLDSDDAATYEKYVHEYTLTADTWTKVEVQIPGKSTLAYNNDNGVGAQVTWVLSAGSNRNLATNDTWQTGNNQSTSNQVNLFNSTANDFYLTGVQLEVGSVATPFEHRSYGDELRRCQRYFQRYQSTSSPNGSIAAGVVGSSTTAYFPFTFVNVFRAAPNMTINTLGSIVKEGTGWYANTAIASIGAQINSTTLQTTQTNNTMSALDASRIGLGMDLSFEAEL